MFDFVFISYICKQTLVYKKNVGFTKNSRFINNRRTNRQIKSYMVKSSEYFIIKKKCFFKSNEMERFINKKIVSLNSNEME